MQVMPLSRLLFSIESLPLSGKTILASAIIDECKSRPDSFTSFFYCHEGDSTSNSAVAVLKGLADQLLDQDDKMLPVCYASHISSGEPCLRSLIQAKKVLQDLCTPDAKFYIIVDGLDECEQAERKQILETLMAIATLCNTGNSGSVGKLRVLFVSQNYVDIRKAVLSQANNKGTPNIVQIQDTDTKGDIKIYTRHWVEQIDLKFGPFSDDVTEYLRDLTVENAKGKCLKIPLRSQPPNYG